MTSQQFSIPRPGLRWLPVWRRNFLVWRKLAIPAVLGNLADPLIYMLGLGYGLGGLLPQVGRRELRRLPRRWHRRFQHHERGDLRGALLGFLAHARAENLGCDPQHAAFHRPRAERRAGLGGEQEPAFRPRHSGRYRRPRPHALVARAVGDPSHLPHRPRFRRAGPDRLCAGAVLRFLHVLLHAVHHADDAGLRRLLPRRPAAGDRAGRRQLAATVARRFAGAAAAARPSAGQRAGTRRCSAGHRGRGFLYRQRADPAAFAQVSWRPIETGLCTHDASRAPYFLACSAGTVQMTV